MWLPFLSCLLYLIISQDSDVLLLCFRFQIAPTLSPREYIDRKPIAAPLPPRLLVSQPHLDGHSRHGRAKLPAGGAIVIAIAYNRQMTSSTLPGHGEKHM